MKVQRSHKVTVCFLVIFGIILLCISAPAIAIPISYIETIEGDLPLLSLPRADVFLIGDLDLGMNVISGTISRRNEDTDDNWDALRVTLPDELVIDNVELCISNFTSMDNSGGGEMDYTQIGNTMIYTHIFSGDETANLANIFPTHVPTDYQFDIFPRFRSSFDWGLKINVSSSPVPEPSTILLLGGGLVGLAWYGRKRKRT